MRRKAFAAAAAAFATGGALFESARGARAAGNIIGSPSVPVGYETRAMTQRKYPCTLLDLGGTSRVFFNVIADCNQVQFRFDNFYDSHAGETNLPAVPATITVNASLEDPRNLGTVLYRLTFGGRPAASIGWNGYIYSDPIDDTFLAGYTLAVRTNVIGTAGASFPCNSLVSANWTYPAGYGYNATDYSIYGDNYAQDSGGSGADDTLTAGTAWITRKSSVPCYGPLGAFGQRVSKSPVSVVGIAGDSIGWGFGDANYGELGYIMRALRAARIPSINLSASSETLSTVASNPLNYRMRRSCLQYCTDVIVEYGTNDIFLNKTSLAVTKSLAQTIYGQIVNRGARAWGVTVLPTTTSTPSPASRAAAQSVQSQEPVRTAWNDTLRAATDPSVTMLAGYFESADRMEVNSANVFTRNGGLIYCGPGNDTAYTADNLHPNALLTPLLQAAIKSPLFLS